MNRDIYLIIPSAGLGLLLGMFIISAHWVNWADDNAAEVGRLLQECAVFTNI